MSDFLRYSHRSDSYHRCNCSMWSWIFFSLDTFNTLSWPIIELKGLTFSIHNRASECEKEIVLKNREWKKVKSIYVLLIQTITCHIFQQSFHWYLWRNFLHSEMCCGRKYLFSLDALVVQTVDELWLVSYSYSNRFNYIGQYSLNIRHTLTHGRRKWDVGIQNPKCKHWTWIAWKIFRFRFKKKRRYTKSWRRNESLFCHHLFPLHISVLVFCSRKCVCLCVFVYWKNVCSLFELKTEENILYLNITM